MCDIQLKVNATKAQARCWERSPPPKNLPTRVLENRKKTGEGGVTVREYKRRGNFQDLGLVV